MLGREVKEKMFRKNMFRAKLAEAGITLKEAAAIIGVSETTLYRKENGQSDFTRNEIQLLKQALKLSPKDVEAIFFAKKLTQT